MHGWLDNANSFARVGPLLRNFKLVALDLAGQGQSDFRSPDSGYDLLDELRDLHEVTNQLSPGRPVDILAHSRGAVICNLFAAIFPQRVRRLVLIDAIEPFPSELAGLPASIGLAIEEATRLRGMQGSLYANREIALKARIGGLTPVSLASAELLAERSLAAAEQGFIWRADQRLKGPSGFRVSTEMREGFYRGSDTPTLVIEPLDGMLRMDPRFANAGQHQTNLTRVQVPGGHHCHMDDCPERVAELVADWFSRTPESADITPEPSF